MDGKEIVAQWRSYGMVSNAVSFGSMVATIDAALAQARAEEREACAEVVPRGDSTESVCDAMSHCQGCTGQVLTKDQHSPIGLGLTACPGCHSCAKLQATRAVLRTALELLREIEAQWLREHLCNKWDMTDQINILAAAMEDRP